jgi:hypothetical protein
MKLTYEEWKKRFAEEVQQKLHMHPDDCPDIVDTYALYRDGETPKKAAKQFVKAQLEEA